MQIVLFFVLALFCSTSFAEDYLQFPIEKNHAEILPQRFEYQLINRDLFRVGNVLMDANLITVQIQPSKSDKNFRFKFTWPAGLVDKGEIQIRDNSGKAIWFSVIDPGSVKTNPLQQDINGLNLKADTASYEKTDVQIELIQKLQQLPFFRFCVLKTEQSTKVHVCSKDLFYKSIKKGASIQTRDSLRNESFVEINGKAVNPQGMVFLQGINDILSMRALLLSGASIDVDTRMKPVDWVDIVESDKTKQIIVTAIGAEPTEEKNIVRHNENSWSAELDAERPIIYLKGEGGIPLRQEFIITGKIRSEKVTIPYVSSPPTLTYSHEIVGTLKAPSGVTFSRYDQQSDVEANGSTYNWTLKNLETDRKNRRFIKVNINGEEFVGAHDSTRGYGKEFSVTANILKSADIKWIQWYSPSWGYQLSWSQVLIKKNSDPDLNGGSLRLLYRFTPSLHLTQDSSYLGIGANALLVDKQSITSPTILFGRIATAPKWASGTFQYEDWSLEYGSGGSSTGYTLSSVIRAQYLLRAEVRKRNFMTVGLKFESYSIYDGVNSFTLQWPTISFGYIFLF